MQPQDVGVCTHRLQIKLISKSTRLAICLFILIGVNKVEYYSKFFLSNHKFIGFVGENCQLSYRMRSTGDSKI